MKKNREATPPPPDSEALQLTLWDEQERADDKEAVIAALDRDDVISRDPIFLHDVPIASSSADHVKDITITIPDKNGGTRTEQRLGKILQRYSPHPEYVQLNSKIVLKEGLRPEELERGKAVMVPTVTTVLYHSGVVQPLHLEIMYIILAKLAENIKKFGDRSGQVRLTKVEISSMMGLELNGRLRDDIESALKTLQGVHVSKAYFPPEGTAAAIKTEINRGGVIVNSMVMKSVSRRHGAGRPADVIEVDVNPELVRAVMGISAKREYITRAFNWSKSITEKVPWKRMLYRMVDARFDLLGYFRIPLQELWVGCLGKDQSDIKDPKKWRYAKYQMMTAFRSFEETGFIMNLHSFARRRAPNRGGDATGVNAKDNTPVQIDGEDYSTSIQMNRSDLDQAQNEWITCIPGPAYYAAKPLKKNEFAAEILKTFYSPEEVQKVMKSVSVDFVLDSSYGRLRVITDTIGDRRERMPIEQWFTDKTPVSPLTYLIKFYLDEHDRRERSSRTGDLFRGVNATYFNRRLMVSTTPIKKHLADKDFVLIDLQGDSVEGEVSPTYLDAYRLALSAVLKRRGFDDSCKDRTEWEFAPDKKKAFDDATPLALTIALSVTGQILWESKALQKAFTLHGYPLDSTRDIPRDLWLAVRRSYPSLTSLCDSMGIPSAPLWEQELGRRFRRRLVEHVIELRELDRLDPSGSKPVV